MLKKSWIFGRKNSKSWDDLGATRVLGYFEDKPTFQIIIFWQRNFNIKARPF